MDRLLTRIRNIVGLIRDLVLIGFGVVAVSVAALGGDPNELQSHRVALLLLQFLAVLTIVAILIYAFFAIRATSKEFRAEIAAAQENELTMSSRNVTLWAGTILLWIITPLATLGLVFFILVMVFGGAWSLWGGLVNLAAGG